MADQHQPDDGRILLDGERIQSFSSKALAREWARSASPQGYTLWIQDAHPEDDGPADGYLLARRSRMRGNEEELPGEQVGVLDP